MKNVIAALTVAVALALTGCAGAGGGANATPKPPSEAEWRSAVETRIGHPFRSDAAWGSYRDSWRDTCEGNRDGDWAMTVAVRVDYGDLVSDIEDDVSFACPDQLDDFKESVAEVQEATDRADRVCSSDPQLLTREDLDFYEAVC